MTSKTKQAGSRKEKKTTVEVTGTKHIAEQMTLKNPRRAAELFRKKHGIYPDWIGARAVIGHDEGTGEVILSGDAYRTDGDGHYILTRKNNRTSYE